MLKFSQRDDKSNRVAGYGLRGSCSGIRIPRCGLLVSGLALGSWRFEVGGLNILSFSLKPLRRLPLSSVDHRADQQQATGSQQPVTSSQRLIVKHRSVV